MIERLTFDAPTHTYRIDGDVVPSVTQVIGAAWPELWRWCHEFARDRGSAVHQAVHLAILGDLDRDFLAAEIEGYVAAAERALAELGIEVIAAEMRVASLVHRYAGTLDVLGKRKGKLVILDWKSGDPGLSAGVQLAAYAAAYHEMTGTTVSERLAVWLHNDGTYHVHPYKDRADWNYFLSALTVTRWPGVTRDTAPELAAMEVA